MCFLSRFYEEYVIILKLPFIFAAYEAFRYTKFAKKNRIPAKTECDIKPNGKTLVPVTGLEPVRICGSRDFKSLVSAYSTTPANFFIYFTTLNGTCQVSR